MSTQIATQSQSSTFSVGPNPGNNLATITVTFPQPFATTPVVTANTLQGTNFPGSINDTFAVSITQVSPTKFSANIYRVDNIVNNAQPGATGGGWAQNLQLGWTASVS